MISSNTPGSSMPFSSIPEGAGQVFPAQSNIGNAEAPPAGQPDPRSRLKRWGYAWAAWTALALLFAVQDYLALKGTPREGPFMEMLLHKLLAWWLWGAISPVIIAFARRFPISGRHAIRNVLLHIPAGFVCAVTTVVLFLSIGELFGLIDYQDMAFMDVAVLSYKRSFGIYFAIYAGTVLFYHALEFYRAYRRRERLALQLEARLAEARLDALRMQLQPHFLFNTLHGISALMEQDVTAARRMISRLSQLLRLSLENDAAQEIALANELEFLEQYVEIQRMRFHDRLTVTIETAPEARGLLVPRLILQPLVENSIRYGLARHAHAGCIDVTASLEGNRLRIVVYDNGPGLDGKIREGVGIGNTRARLEHLYGSDQQFTIDNAPEGGCIVTIIIPARPAIEQENNA